MKRKIQVGIHIFYLVFLFILHIIVSLFNMSVKWPLNMQFSRSHQWCRMDVREWCCLALAVGSKYGCQNGPFVNRSTEHVQG